MSVNKYYQNNSGRYTMNSARKRNILALIPADTKTVLDIGCGQGELASALKANCISVTGVDISEQALKIAAPTLAKSYCFDIEKNWPEDLLNQKFDCMIASEVIEHLFAPEEFLQKVRKILKKDGCLILTTPNFLFWKNRWRIFMGKFEYADSGFYDRGHIHFFSRLALLKEITRAGYKIDQELHFYPNFYTRGLNFLGDKLPGLFAYQLIIRVKLNE